MAYGRKGRGRRYGRRRRGGVPRNLNTAWQLAKSAWAGVKMIKGIVNSEKKSYTNSLSTTLSTTPSLVAISGIAQGDDFTAREGRSILAKSCQLTGYHTASTAAATTVVRYIIFIDNDNSGSAPTALQLMGSATPDGYALRNADPIYMKRFKILLDKTYMLDNTGKGITSKIDYFGALSHHIKFSGTGASDYGQGGVFLMVWCTNGSNQPTCNIQTRLRYYDN